MKTVVVLGCSVLPLVIFSASIAARSKSAEPEEIEWECGTDSFTKYISENQIDIDCPDLKKTVNLCCLHHDDCYDKQLGRKFCDDTFCNCLMTATKPSRICSKEDGPLFCNLVRDFGAEAYARSGNTTIVIEETHIIHEVEVPHKENSTEVEQDYESQVSYHKIDQIERHLSSASNVYSSH